MDCNENGALSGLKTTSYAENVRTAYARQRAGPGGDLRQHCGQPSEGTGSNIFVVLDGRLVTPPLSAGPWRGSPGNWSSNGWAVRKKTSPWRRSRVSEAFLTSTGRDVQPIRAIDDRVLRRPRGR